MANTTYSIPLNQPARVAEAMSAVFLHLVSWKQRFNIDFVSCIRNGANLDVTFSDPVPQSEREHIRMSVGL
jgi:hypothetical protein